MPTPILNPSRPATSPADRPRRNLYRPHAAIIQSKLSVHWPVCEPQRPSRLHETPLDQFLLRLGQARRRDVDGFFEIWALQRIRLVEDRQHAQLSAGQ